MIDNLSFKQSDLDGIYTMIAIISKNMSRAVTPSKSIRVLAKDNKEFEEIMAAREVIIDKAYELMVMFKACENVISSVMEGLSPHPWDLKMFHEFNNNKETFRKQSKDFIEAADSLLSRLVSKAKGKREGIEDAGVDA